MSQKVIVVKVNADGIRAKIYGKEYAWNTAKDQFFIYSNGKWTAAEIPAFQKSILKDRHSKWLRKERFNAELERKTAFLKKHNMTGLTVAPCKIQAARHGTANHYWDERQMVEDDRNWGEC